MTAPLAIDIFSPLPPRATDIANHTASILQPLARLAKVRVWTSQTGPVELDIPDLEVRRFDPERPPYATLNRADATFFNLGNNAAFHGDLHAIARRVPGIMILHDVRLQHFFAAYSEREGDDRDYYLDLMERTHGREARRLAQAYIDGNAPLEDLIETAPMTLAALHGSIAAVLHNKAEQQKLQEQTRTPVHFLPLSFAFGPPRPRPLRQPNDPSRLVMVGFIGENRRLLSILEALASMSDRAHYRLDIYGTVEQDHEADAIIAKSGLGGLVSRHGFVSEAVLDEALDQADLALNLRWPSMGEASGSQLRIWAAGLPALVTRVGWYAQLPQESVFMIDPDRERDEFVHHLRALRRTPEIYARAGAAGRRVLERDHSPSAYAEGLVAIAASHRAQHIRRVGNDLAEHCASQLLELGSADLARPLGREIAHRIAELTGSR